MINTKYETCYRYLYNFGHYDFNPRIVLYFIFVECLFKDKSKCNDISLSNICTIWVPAGRDMFIETVDKRQLHADAHVAVCCAWIQR